MVQNIWLTGVQTTSIRKLISRLKRKEVKKAVLRAKRRNYAFRILAVNNGYNKSAWLDRFSLKKHVKKINHNRHNEGKIFGVILMFVFTSGLVILWLRLILHI